MTDLSLVAWSRLFGDYLLHAATRDQYAECGDNLEDAIAVPGKSVVPAHQCADCVRTLSRTEAERELDVLLTEEEDRAAAALGRREEARNRWAVNWARGDR